MRTIIAYDISQDPRRYQVARRLLDRATRMQRSVFEAPDLAQAAYLRLRSSIEGLIDPRTDSLRYYRLCAACAGRTEHYGVGPGLLAAPETFTIIEP